MLNKIITGILRRRHFWRDASFDELSELYTSSMLRSLANSLIGIFVPVYLYQIGFSLQSLFGYYAIWFAFRLVLDIVNAYIIGRIGPKHSLALASLGYATHLILLLSIQSLHWPVWLLALVGGWSMGLYVTAFQTDFSKVKHSKHGGKELGYLSILEKIGGVLGPLIGGLIATFYDPRYTITIAIIMQIIAVVPLFLSAEPVKTRQKIVFRGLLWRKHARDFVSNAFQSTENFLSTIFWPLFIAITILHENTYATLGLIIAISTGVTILFARLIGVMIDESKGGLLLQTGAVLNGLLHLVRPFISTFSGALTVNILNDPITISYQMPYFKGFFDATDSVPGYRIVYISVAMFFSSLLKMCICVAAWYLCFNYEPTSVLKIIFAIAAVCSIGITIERYPALHRRYT